MIIDLQFTKSQDLIKWSKFENVDVYIDKGDERNAGQPYFIENNIYRFSQILEPKYGSGIKIHRVSQIDSSIYKKTPIKEIRMSKMSKADGIHTMSFDENGFFIMTFALELLTFFCNIL